MVSLCLAALAGCSQKSAPLAMGTLERDRIELVAEDQEAILEVAVIEGASVNAGDLVVALDDRRAASRLAAAQAGRDAAAARLAALLRGARREEVDRARALLREAESAIAEAEPELERVRTLVEQGIESHRALERAQAALDESRGRRDAAGAALKLLLNGATVEELDQARAEVASAEASAEVIRLSRDKLRVTAPRSGVIDSLPFQVGERPPPGATVAVLLADRAPYARVYVPARVRAKIRLGDPATITVEGIERTFAGRVRWVSREAAFTPFYALTEQDRGRLAYLAKIDLTEDEAVSLPTGLSVEASFEPSGAQATLGNG